MIWDLPLSVSIDGVECAIRNKCDYRVVLDAISALKDEELELKDRLQCALFIFYEDVSRIKNYESAIKEMFKIINNGEEQEQEQGYKPVLMDWEHDFKNLAPPISRILGYSLRGPSQYTHWYDFIGAYMEIGECTFATIISIRNKRARGKKLEKWEQDFYNENKKIIDLPHKLTSDEEDFLYSDW